MDTSIRLSAETEHRLEFLASEIGRTKDFFLRELIEGGLDELEDYYLTEQAPIRARKGKEKAHAFEDYEQ